MVKQVFSLDGHLNRPDQLWFGWDTRLSERGLNGHQINLQAGDLPGVALGARPMAERSASRMGLHHLDGINHLGRLDDASRQGRGNMVP